MIFPTTINFAAALKDKEIRALNEKLLEKERLYTDLLDTVRKISSLALFDACGHGKVTQKSAKGFVKMSFTRHNSIGKLMIPRPDREHGRNRSVQAALYVFLHPGSCRFP